MSKLTVADYRARFRRIEGKYCPCGNPAEHYTCGIFTCRRCLDMDRPDHPTNLRVGNGRAGTAKSLKGFIRPEKKWSGEYEGFWKTEAFGWGPTLRFLQQLEAA